MSAECENERRRLLMAEFRVKAGGFHRLWNREEHFDSAPAAWRTKLWPILSSLWLERFLHGTYIYPAAKRGRLRNQRQSS